jgi:hypothetical protein
MPRADSFTIGPSIAGADTEHPRRTIVKIALLRIDILRSIAASAIARADEKLGMISARRETRAKDKEVPFPIYEHTLSRHRSAMPAVCLAHANLGTNFTDRLVRVRREPHPPVLQEFHAKVLSRKAIIEIRMDVSA